MSQELKDRIVRLTDEQLLEWSRPMQTLRPGTLVAEKEITIVFSDNREERFVRVNACTQCG